MENGNQYLTENDIIQGLNTEQSKAVKQTNGPVLILAGAGSGKTRTIVHRIAYLIHVEKVPPRKIVAVTFTNKASLEMLNRTVEIAGPESIECTIKTFHSFGLYLLRILADKTGYGSNFTIWDDSDQVGALSSICEKFGDDKLMRNEVRQISQLIGGFKDKLISPENLSGKVDLDQYSFGQYLPQIYHLYEQKKKDSCAMDFSDLLYQCVKILQEHPDALDRLHQRYHYFLIDEYQDTNHAQYTLVQLLASAKKNLMVVGDDDQAIYSWRGADVTNILEFQRDFPEAAIIKLEQNYRSTKTILQLANSIIKNNPKRMEKTLWSDLETGSRPVLKTLNTDIEESDYIAETISQALQKTIPEEIAVLYRTNAQSRLLEEVLLRKKIPYRIFGGISFYGRKEVKDIISYLKLLVNPFDESSFMRTINTPSRGIGEKSIEKIFEIRTDYAREHNAIIDFIQLLKVAADQFPAKTKETLLALHEWLKTYSEKAQKNIDLGMLYSDILEKSGLEEMYKEEDKSLSTSKSDNLAELKNSIITYRIKNPGATLGDYLQDISLYSSKNTEEMEKSVNLMTVHNAKGLEFKTVIIAGLDDDIFPHYLSKGRDEGEEERRLLYVAITRAKKEIYFTRSRSRYVNGFPQQCKPSIFIAEMPADLLEKVEPAASSSRSTYNKSFPQTASYHKNVTTRNNSSPGINNISINNTGNGNYANGTRLRHPTFGAGRVIKTEGSGDGQKIHLIFQDGKSRKFLLKYTKLEKI